MLYGLIRLLMPYGRLRSTLRHAFYTVSWPSDAPSMSCPRAGWPSDLPRFTASRPCHHGGSFGTDQPAYVRFPFASTGSKLTGSRPRHSCRPRRMAASYQRPRHSWSIGVLVQACTCLAVATCSPHRRQRSGLPTPHSAAAQDPQQDRPPRLAGQAVDLAYGAVVITQRSAGHLARSSLSAASCLSCRAVLSASRRSPACQCPLPYIDLRIPAMIVFVSAGAKQLLFACALRWAL